MKRNTNLGNFHWIVVNELHIEARQLFLIIKWKLYGFTSNFRIDHIYLTWLCSFMKSFENVLNFPFNNNFFDVVFDKFFKYLYILADANLPRNSACVKLRFKINAAFQKPDELSQGGIWSYWAISVIFFDSSSFRWIKFGFLPLNHRKESCLF